VWGGVGTDAQHSVFQMLHQGTSLIFSEFILVKIPGHQLQGHHDELLANGIPQTAAFFLGQDQQMVEAIYKDEDLSEVEKAAKIFAGNKPSMTNLIDRLTLKSLGALLACTPSGPVGLA